MRRLLLFVVLCANVWSLATADDVDCVLSAPYVDGPCGEPCGGGLQMLTRDVITLQEGNGLACPFPLVETIACNAQPCPEKEPELRSNNGDFEIHLGNEHTLKVVKASGTVDVLADLAAAGDATANDLRDLELEVVTVSAEVGLVTGELRGKLSDLQDSVLGAAQSVDQSLATVNAKLDVLAKDKADRTELESKANTADVQAVTDLLSELNNDLRGSFAASHDVHNASLKLLFDELDGLTTLTTQLDSDINTVDEHRQALGKRVIAAEQSLAEASIARQTLEDARESLELRVSVAEATIELLKTTLFGPHPLPFGTGRDGDVTLTGTREVVNYIILHDTLGSSIVLNTCTDLKAGDELFLHQTQFKSDGLAGHYEFTTITDLVDEETQCIVFLQQPLKTDFRSAVYSMTGPYAAQAVRVPHYKNVTIEGTLSAPAWDGRRGGLVVFKATGTVVVTGTIDASLQGFRGSLQRPSDSDYSCGYAGESESAVFAHNDARDCRNYGSGGGPGNGQGGGYGGAHRTVGNKPECGGCDAGCGNGPTIDGITGKVPYAPTPIGDEKFSRIYFGGSGGASGSHGGGVRRGAAGGRSGGIIVIAGQGGISGTGTIRAQGGNGQDGYQSSDRRRQPMGGGGGGAGGAIWLKSTGDMNVKTIQINGGKGGIKATYVHCNDGTAGGNGGVGWLIKTSIIP